MMATFFSLCTCSCSSLINILLLLSLTISDLLLRSDAAALNDVCSQTKQPRRCLTLIESTNSGSKTASLPELGQIVIVAALDVSGDVKIKVHNLYLTVRDPKLKALYLNCEDLYRSGLDQLLAAPEYIQNRTYGKLRAAAGVVRAGVTGCAPVIGNNGGLKRENIDTGILADAIVIIANKLA